MSETEESVIIDEHQDTDRLAMIFEAQGLEPEAAAEKAAGIVEDAENGYDVV